VNDCSERGFIAKTSRAFGTSKVSVLHDCTPMKRSILAIRTLDGWFLSAFDVTQAGAIVNGQRYTAEIVREDVRAGRLYDGTHAVVHSIEVLRGQPRPFRFGYVQVCSAEGPIACTMELSYECAETGCIAPTLSRGWLTIVDSQRGAEVFVLNRVTEPEPKR